jgi:serine protein kinase
MQPSRLKQICIARTESGDENNQDVSSLVGEVDILKLEFFSRNDPDAYPYSGSLNRISQGLMEFVEIFKPPAKLLHPLLRAVEAGDEIGLTDDLVTVDPEPLEYSGVQVAHLRKRSRDGPQYRTSWSRDGPTVLS